MICLDKTNSENIIIIENYLYIILIVIFLILLVAIILFIILCVYCCRKKHSKTASKVAPVNYAAIGVAAVESVSLHN